MLISYTCNNSDCKNSISKFFKTHTEVAPFLDCGACGTGKLERDFEAPTSKSTLTVDNGSQAKSVEILSDVVEQEREKVNRDQSN
jgi:hypothetical protein